MTGIFRTGLGHSESICAVVDDNQSRRVRRPDQNKRLDPSGLAFGDRSAIGRRAAM